MLDRGGLNRSKVETHVCAVAAGDYGYSRRRVGVDVEDSLVI